jgi:pimeloyl-ACP methyl ester carboxylesterase
MARDIVFYEGERKKPVAIFIHGLGMDSSIWENPSESHVLGGVVPISSLLSANPAKKDFGYSTSRPKAQFIRITSGMRKVKLTTSFHDAKSMGFSVATWSQKRPVGPVDEAVAELRDLIKVVGRFAENGIILIGHSRGGLIARKYMMSSDRRIKGLFTLCTPNKGSSIAKLAVYLSPLSLVISPLISVGKDKGALNRVLTRMNDLLESRAVGELLPNSTFFKSLKDTQTKGVYYLTVGGTSPSLLSLYRWKWKSVPEGQRTRWFLIPERIFSVPDIFEKIIPKGMYPLELKKNMGDGIVAAESSRLDWCDAHYNFALNHAAVLFDTRVRKIIRSALNKILNSMN